MMNAYASYLFYRVVLWIRYRQSGLVILPANQSPCWLQPMGVFFCDIADSQTCQTLRTRANIRISPSRSRPGFYSEVAMQISACPIALPLGKLAALAGVKAIAVHCSATRPTAIMGVREIHRMHVERGFACVGYHYVIKRDGTIERGRPEDKMGAHVEGHNRDSLGVCLIGGIDADGKAKNNFTQDQFDSLKNLLLSLHGKYPKAVIQGHRDFYGDTNKDGKIDSRDWLKECPCFDVKSWWSTQR